MFEIYVWLRMLLPGCIAFYGAKPSPLLFVVDNGEVVEMRRALGIFDAPVDVFDKAQCVFVSVDEGEGVLGGAHSQQLKGLNVNVHLKAIYIRS